MNKFPLPLMLPAGSIVRVSQPYGASAIELEPVGPNGEKHFHYGIDLVWGTDSQMFGTPIILPADGCIETQYLMPPGSPQQTPFVKFDLTGASGNKYSLTLGHISELRLSNVYKKDQIVALAGNYGMLTPPPTISNPFAGTHLHLGLQLAGKWVDPALYFDVTQFTVGPRRDPMSCVPRINWACEQVASQLHKLVSNA